MKVSQQRMSVELENKIIAHRQANPNRTWKRTVNKLCPHLKWESVKADFNNRQRSKVGYRKPVSKAPYNQKEAYENTQDPNRNMWKALLYNPTLSFQQRLVG